MKSDKKLLELYNKAKGDSTYYSFEDFKQGAKAFTKEVKHGSTVCGMYVSRSGMLRRFNFDRHNMVLNICYNNKFSWDAVKVGGCGMDMHWYLKFRTCEKLLTDGEMDKYNINSRCSGGRIL